MQLKNKGPLCQALSVASATLLGLEPAQSEILNQWDTDSAVLYYAEDGRVRVIEPVTSLRKEINDDEFITIQLTYDTISGSTPNGATATATPQLFTSPSCQSAYLTPANEQPLRSFNDQRGAVSATWDVPVSERVRNQFGLHFSAETDYTSAGLNNTMLMDFNQRNTTLTLSVGLDSDHVDPADGKPSGMSSIFSCTPSGDGEEEEEDEGINLESFGKIFTEYQSDKRIISALAGITQVLSPQALLQLNYSLNRARGYLTDPYKIISVVDAGNGDTVDYLFEQRPDSHIWQSLYAKLVYGLKQDVIHISYRYYWDDWQIHSHTVEAAYLYNIDEHINIRPWIRLYEQSAAEFYRHSIADNESLNHASADQRLAAFTGTTVGVRVAWQWQSKNSIYLRLAHMQQTGDSHPNDAIGSQRNQDLFADLEANIVQLGLEYFLE